MCSVRITRREALKAGGVAGAAIVVASQTGPFGSVLNFLTPVDSRRPQPAIEERIPGVCLQCPAGCGIIGRVVDGRLVKIDGNTLHPINEGRLCPKGQIGVQILYDPDRIKGPYIRQSLLDAYDANDLAGYLNPPGGIRERDPEDFVEVPGNTPEEKWNTAIAILGALLKILRDNGESHKLVFLSGRTRGQMGGFIGRFLAAYGSPNDVGHSSICSDGSPQAHYATQGWKAYAGYDWDNTNYLLCFGAGFIEAWRPTTRLLRAYGTMRRGRPVRAKIVQVDSRLSVTAAKADEWIPVKPATDGALATALAHVIVRDHLYDEEYVKAHTDLPHLVRLDTGEPFEESSWTETIGGKDITYRKIYVWDANTGAPAVWNTKTKAYEPEDVDPSLEPPTPLTINGVECKSVFQLWWEEVLEAMTPQSAAGITGVDAGTIERIGREFATTKPAIAAGERGASMQTNGLYNRMAIHALNALVGSIDVPGGVLYQPGPPLQSFPAVVTDDIAKNAPKTRIDYAGTKYYPMAGKVYQAMPDLILGKPDPGGRQLPAPYEVKALFAYYTNPFFSTPDVGRWTEAVKRVPLIVTFSPFMDETTAMADLVLPDDTYLERWQDDIIYPSLGYPVAAIRQPMVDRVYNTMDTGTVLIRLAKEIGGSVADSFPWNDFQEVLKFRYQGILDAKAGSVGDRAVESMASIDEFWQAFTEKGVWSKPPYEFGKWNDVFKTDTGKFEVLSGKLEHKLRDMAKAEAAANGTTEEEELEKLLQLLKINVRGEAVFMPHYEPPRYAGDESQYPLHLVTYKLMAHAEGRGANVPFLRDLTASHLNGVTLWHTWVEVNPSTAAKLGIKDGQWVWVEGPTTDESGIPRRISVKAHLHPGARPDTVSIPFELGHTSYGRWAKNSGANPNWILANEYDLLGGLAAFTATRVRLYPAGGEA